MPITSTFIIFFIMSTTSWLMFGYEIGSWDVTSIPTAPGFKSYHCENRKKNLQLFVATFFLPGLIATIFASYIIGKFGRRLTTFVAGLTFLYGVMLNVVAQELSMLTIGKVLISVGVNFAKQVVPLLLSEVAPNRLIVGGRLVLLFQLICIVGTLFANLVNYGTQKIKGGWGWRVSLGLAGVPGVILTLGSLLMSETPKSLIEQGHLEEAKILLRRVRGTDDIEAEFSELLNSSRITVGVKHAFKNLLERRNRPQFVIAIFLQLFQQLTGINIILFYAPFFFNRIGFGEDASLYTTIVVNAVNIISNLASMYLVNKVNRRTLFLEAGVQMLFSQVVIAIILKMNVTNDFNKSSPILTLLIVLMVVTFVVGISWSWGSLPLLIPKEIFPLEIGLAGQIFTCCANLLFTFITSEAFLPMLCHFRSGIFLFFSCWIVIMSFFVLLLLPETKDVPIEEMKEKVWKQHWFWKKFIDDDSLEVV